MTPTRRWLCRITLVLALPAAAVCLLAPLAPWWWYGELASHWTLHAALLLLPALACWRGRAAVAGPLLAVLLAGLWPSWRCAWDDRAPAPAGPVVRIAAANLYAHNPDRDRAVAALLAQEADVVVASECLPRSGDLRRFDDPARPYRVWAPYPARGDGMILLSRHPLSAARVVEDGTVPYIDATVEVPGARPLRVIACHPLAPYHAGYQDRWRNRQWTGIGAAAGPGPVVVVGDLNGTPRTWAWGAWRQAGLQRPAGAMDATWPAGLGPAGIAIDHVLVRGAGLAVRPFPVPGGDHRGLLATVAPGPCQPSTGTPNPK